MELVLDEFMQQLIIETKATHYLGVFTPKQTFRNALYSEYKANRAKQVAPDWLNFWKPKIIQWCVEKYQFFVGNGIEADDVLSIMRGDDVVYCSPDKDIRQIPGRHYDYSKQKWEGITEEEAAYRFWIQMLVGDSTDNIPGCKGIGEKKAPLIVTRDMTWLEMQRAVLDTYRANKKYNSVAEADEQFALMRKLLTLLTPKLDLVLELSKHVIAVAYADAELNIETDESRVLQTDQREHESVILRASTDLHEQV